MHKLLILSLNGNEYVVGVRTLYFTGTTNVIKTSIFQYPVYDTISFFILSTDTQYTHAAITNNVNACTKQAQACNNTPKPDCLFVPRSIYVSPTVSGFHRGGGPHLHPMRRRPNVPGSHFSSLLFSPATGVSPSKQFFICIHCLVFKGAGFYRLEFDQTPTNWMPKTFFNQIMELIF